MNEPKTTPCQTHLHQPAQAVSRNAAGQGQSSRPPRHLGPLHHPNGGAVELYEDPETESTFAVREGETVEQAQARHRAAWESGSKTAEGSEHTDK